MSPYRRLLLSVLILAILLSACQIPTIKVADATQTSGPPLATAEKRSATAAASSPAVPTAFAPTFSGAPYLNPSLSPQARAADLLGRMTLAEKIGQMTQIEKNSLSSADQVTQQLLGSVLSGGGGVPSPNEPQAWLEMVNAFQQAALRTRLGIPILYGIDAVHGDNNVFGATIFPHNIGLGAAGDAALVGRIGQATAAETAATGIRWNFAPVLAVVQDVRWGRTYESYSEDTALVAQLGAAYIQGLQGSDLRDPASMLATPKHYIGDGGTTWGSSRTSNYMLDQGDTRLSEDALRALFLPPYQAAIQAGALSVMASFSSWNGTKMHAQKHLLTDVLKGELGFTGFIVSDWGAIDQISPDYAQAVAAAINAGIDMNMVPSDAARFINTLTLAVQSGRVPQGRIDDAVRRILTVKFRLGLFEHPLAPAGGTVLDQVGSAEHRALARQAVAQSLVLLKNQAQALPLSKQAGRILVAGQGASDIGMQCGGWTIEWQGKAGAITQGTTILQGIQDQAAAGQVVYSRSGEFSASGEVGIVVVGEQPYAEGQGDSATLALSAADTALVQKVRPLVKKLVVVLLSGRPLVINAALQAADAFVAAWLPGSEGAGVADVLFGDAPFTGRLPFTWPRSAAQLHSNPLFAFGYGLKY